MDPEIVWFAERFRITFGREPTLPRPLQAAALVDALHRAGRATAATVLEQRRDAGLEPRALAYFLPALADRGADTRNGGRTAADILALAHDLEGQGR